jgi:ATP-dependent DNA helicase RecG
MKKMTKEPFDERPNLEANCTAIDKDEVKDFLKLTQTMEAEIPKTSIKEVILNHLKVLKYVQGELKPTNTALLFFSPDVSKYLTQHEIKIARFKGVTQINLIDRQEIKGPIYHMLKDAENFFRRNTCLANKIVGFKRVDIPEYPYDAIREALINAIAHRDYNHAETPITFSIFDDRVEITNPGGLLPGLKINKLKGLHKTRNNKICEIFAQTKDMEKSGTGIGKMKKIMAKHGLEEPEFEEKEDSFLVRFYGPGDDILDLTSNIPDKKTIDLKEIKLNDRQIEALKLMVNQKMIFTNRSYKKTFKVSQSTAARDLKDLFTKKQVIRIGKSRNIKYKAT